jgi:hypothetical protein
MYIRRINAMNVRFKFQTAHAKAEETALLDSGATENFIDEETWKKMGVGRRPLSKSIKVYNVDGTENRKGELTHYCRLRILFDGKEDLQDFYITTLGKDRLILGFPFLQKFNPTVDWKRGRFKKGVVSIQSAMYKHLDRTVLAYQKRALKTLGRPKEGEAIFVRRANIAQEMAHQYQAKREKVDESVPEQFRKFTKVFSEKESRRFPPDRNPNYQIEFTDKAPEYLNCKVYPLTKLETETLKKYLADELEKGFLEPSKSAFTSPVFFINKKDGKEKRLVIDYRRLNEFTKRDNGPLPRMDDVLRQLEGMELFSKFDIRWGYNNMPIEESDKHKGAFKTPLGTYQSKVLTFGMRNAPAAFSRLMQRDFRTWLDKWQRYKDTTGVNYMDDFGVASKNTPLGREGHEECIKDLLTLMEEKSYFLRASKCKWMQPEMEFLGVLVKEGAMRVEPSKREGIANWPRTLKDKDDVRRTMGMLQFQRRFIPGFSHIAKPIFNTLKKGPFVWTDEAKEALDRIIRRIADDPVIKHPNPDKPFEVEIDASAYATGAALIQRDDEGGRVEVGYHSEALNKTERNYDVYDREFLALIRAFRFWRHLLEGSPGIKVYTDHANLAKH